MDDDTPLHDASINGHIEVAELLIAHGANVVCTNHCVSVCSINCVFFIYL